MKVGLWSWKAEMRKGSADERALRHFTMPFWCNRCLLRQRVASTMHGG